MKPVGRLGNDLAARAVEHVRGHLFAAVRGQAVEKDRIGLGVRQQVLIDLVGGEDTRAARRPRALVPCSPRRRYRRRRRL